MRLFTIAALLLLVGCVPDEPSAPRLHDISLYGFDGNHVYGYFYGPPTTLQTAERSLVLSEGRVDDPFAIEGALLVNGEPYLKQAIAALPSPPVEVSRIPMSTDLVVRVHEPVKEVLYFDGQRWFTLLDEGEAGFNARVVPRERIAGLRRVGELNTAEAGMLERALRGHGPLAVTVLPEPRNRPRMVDGLEEYRRTALFVQTELPVDRTVTPPPIQELTWDELARGTQASTGERTEFHLATSQERFISLWNLAYGRQLNVPPAPSLDFRRDTVVGFFLGQRPTGGYSVTVRDVTLEGGEVYVDVRITEPGPGDITTQALTSPWVLVRVTRPNLNVVWFRDASTGELIGAARRTE
jgi:hypothetical protein